MIEFDEVSYGYGGTALLSDVSLKLTPGSFHFLTGPSGTGKTTLMKLCYGALKAERGRVSVFGQDVRAMSRDDIAHTRQRIDAALRALGARVEIAAESHQPDVLTQMVRLGLGWTVLPAPSQVAGVTTGPVVLERRLVLAQRSGTVRDPAVDELAERLRSAPVSRPPASPRRPRRPRRA